MKLLQSETPPSITIFHGTHDEVIPVEMGRQLAALAPKSINYQELPHSHHNNILQDAMPVILQEIHSIPGLDSENP